MLKGNGGWKKTEERGVREKFTETKRTTKPLKQQLTLEPLIWCLLPRQSRAGWLPESAVI